MLKDRIKTIAFLICITLLFVWFGSFFGKAGAITALIIAVAINSFAYFFSDKMILGLYGARPMNPDDFPRTYEIVHELTQKMNIPMPKLWLVKSPVANAFATGRNPRHAAVAVTTGAMDLLDRNELRGVLAHELAHIKNRDILFATVASTMATAISYLAQSVQHATFVGKSKSDREKQRSNPLGFALAVILVPIAAVMMRLAVSRSREFQADETGSYYSRDPLSLASALQKLHEHKNDASFDPRKFSRAATADLFIVNPFLPVKGRSWVHLFLTHPPMQARVERLKKINEELKKKPECV